MQDTGTASDVQTNGNGNGETTIPDWFQRDWKLAVVDTETGKPVMVGPAFSEMEAMRFDDVGDTDFGLSLCIMPPDAAGFRWCPKSFKFVEDRPAPSVDPLDHLPPEDEPTLIQVPDMEHVGNGDGHEFRVPACDGNRDDMSGVTIHVRVDDRDLAERKARWFMRRVALQAERIQAERIRNSEYEHLLFGVSTNHGHRFRNEEIDEEIEIVVWNAGDARAISKLARFIDRLRECDIVLPKAEEITQPDHLVVTDPDEARPADYSLVINTEHEQLRDVSIHVANARNPDHALAKAMGLVEHIDEGDAKWPEFESDRKRDEPTEDSTDEPAPAVRGNGDQFAWMNPATHTLVIDTEDELQDVQFQVVNAKTDCEAVQKLQTVIDHLRETEITLPRCENTAD